MSISRGARVIVAGVLLILGLVPSVPRAQPQAREPLAVMSFNIRYGTAKDGENEWTRRRAMLFDQENPDHYVTAQVVESACWMAGSSRDYVEQLETGLKPHGVREKYYFARGPQLVNRIVDISGSIDRKVESNRST